MKLLILSALTLIATGTRAQLLYNSGATVKVQAGAVLYVEGTIQNTAGGTIENDGTIELKGDLDNEATIDASDPANIFVFSGDAHSNVWTNGAVLNKVQVKKGAAFNVILQEPMTVSNNIDFIAPAPGIGNKIVLEGHDLTMNSAATFTGHDENEFVLTNGAGALKRVYGALESFTYPVGTDVATPTYNPATLNVTAGPNDTYSVRSLAAPTDGDGLTGTPIDTAAVNAVWDIQEMGTQGDNTANLTLAWTDVSDELPGFADAANSVSRNDGTNGWDALKINNGSEVPDAGPPALDTRTRNGLTGFGAFAVGGISVGNELVLGIDVFLSGAYNTSTDLMSDLLRTQSYIPTTEPYTAAPYNFVHAGYGGGETVSSSAVFNQTDANDDITDWIVVELRSANPPFHKRATKTALLQRDGDIVDLDGSSVLKIPGIPDSTYIVALRHRNHTRVRTAVHPSLSNTLTTLDFKVAGTAFDNGIGSPPQKDLEGGVMGLWGGDANFDARVRVISQAFPFIQSDRAYILETGLGGNPNGQVFGYHSSDVNMDGRVRAISQAFPFVQSDGAFILEQILNGVPTGQITEDN